MQQIPHLGHGAAHCCTHHAPRRAFLAGMAALGAGMLLPTVEPAAQPKAAKPYRIDVHAHLSPPDWIAALGPKKLVTPPSVEWTVEKHIADMDRAGVETSILSVTTPGLWFGDNAAAGRLARECNDYAAKLVQAEYGRFGMFVALPLPDIDGSLKEIAYGLDTLKADGVGLFTSYGDKWLGDPAFAPVFEELNRRKAVVYTHPTTANCCRNLVPGIFDQIIEFGTDTTRAIARMVFSGSAARYPDIRLIFSHAGGTMPFLIERFDFMAALPQHKAAFPDGFRPVARKFYYDTAQTANPGSMAALTKIIPPSQVLFGTDYPFRTAIEHVEGLQKCGAFNARQLRAVERDNALKLLQRHQA